jgi:hypothetical protein
MVRVIVKCVCALQALGWMVKRRELVASVGMPEAAAAVTECDYVELKLPVQVVKMGAKPLRAARMTAKWVYVPQAPGLTVYVWALLE